MLSAPLSNGHDHILVTTLCRKQMTFHNCFVKL